MTKISERATSGRAPVKQRYIQLGGEGPKTRDAAAQGLRDAPTAHTLFDAGLPAPCTKAILRACGAVAAARGRS